MDYVTFDETVELFVYSVFNELWNETECPRLNFKFEDDAYEYFHYLVLHPFVKEGYYTPNITDEDIKTIKMSFDPDVPTIRVRDYKTFFECLKDISNSYEDFEHINSPRFILGNIMRRIWLRMGPNDFDNVENYLKKELRFIHNNLLDDEYYTRKKVSEFNNKDVFGLVTHNSSFFETFRNMYFTIERENKSYFYLPCVHYEIDGDTCYIYAIQKMHDNDKDNIIIHELYKMSSYIKNLECHPTHIYSLILFINILRSHGIKTFKIPTLQVLSYRYHEIVSNKYKKDFASKWPQERIDEINNLSGYIKRRELAFYEDDLNTFNRFVDKEDMISKNKTEGLINILKSVEPRFPDLEFHYDFLSQDWMIEIKEKRLEKNISK